jgi:hypothetical protein
MVHIDIDPVAFSLGPLSVHWYGLMYVVGIAVGLFVAWPYAKWKGITAAQFEKVAIWSIPMGLIGARLYYDLQQPLGQYLTNPILLISVWNGGMAFYGAIFAVVLTVIILAWRMHVSIFAFLDVAVMFAVVGQFFGRIGNIRRRDRISDGSALGLCLFQSKFPCAASRYCLPAGGGIRGNHQSNSFRDYVVYPKKSPVRGGFLHLYLQLLAQPDYRLFLA